MSQVTAAVPAVDHQPGVPPGKRANRRRPPLRRYPRRTPWIYLAPALVVLAGLLVYPIYQLGLISMMEYRQAQVSGGEPATWQGFANYAELFADGEFWDVLVATVLFAAACVLGTVLMGCSLAVLLSRIRAFPGWC